MMQSECSYDEDMMAIKVRKKESNVPSPMRDYAIGLPPPVTVPMKTVYLSGPITGLDYDEARHTWREQFAGMMPPHIHCLSPMRVVSTLQVEQGLDDKPLVEGVKGMWINRAILRRDESDLRTCDAMVAYLKGANKVSQGTVSELGMAHILRKPIIIIMEEEGNVHEHPFNTSIAMWRTDDLEEAANSIIHLLTPGV